MKKNLLLLFLLTSFSMSSQIFGTGNISFNSNFSASISINGNTNTTTLTITVPSNVWFAVGFGGSTMSSGADVFRSDGSNITDAKTTGTFLPGADSQQDWTLVSNDVSNGTRTMVVTRANNTGDTDDFVFNPAESSLSLMWAHGSSSSYAYHGGNRGATAVSVLSTPDFSTLESIKVYPNPTDSDITFSMNNEPKLNVSVYNLLGKKVTAKQITTNDNAISLANFTRGVYMVKITSEDGKRMTTKKVVKN